MKPKQNYKPGPMDCCQTPAYAIDPIADYISGRGIIWESACGDGLLTDAMRALDMAVIDTDIQPPSSFDYFLGEPARWSLTVTNPPYGLKFDWIERSYELGKPWALLMPVETWGAQKAQRMFEKYGVEVMLLDKRVNFKMPNKGWNSSAQFPVAWFCHGILPQSVMYGKIIRRGL